MKYSIYFLFLSMVCALSACTYSVTLVHTEGTASDVVDDTENIKADVSPTLSVPVSPLP